MNILSLTSTGKLCSELQQPHSRIERAIRSLDIQPAAVIDGRAHYDDRAAERIADHLRTSTEKGS